MKSKNAYLNSGIKLFKRSKFDEAIQIFSLAYDKFKDDEFLSLILLCEAAKNNAVEAISLYEMYVGDFKDRRIQSIEEVVEILESDDDFNKELDYENAITYKDFKKIVNQNGDFKETFQNIIFSSKVIITNKEDLLEFVENLVKYGYKEMGLNYLESSVQIFVGDTRLERLVSSLR